MDFFTDPSGGEPTATSAAPPMNSLYNKYKSNNLSKESITILIYTEWANHYLERAQASRFVHNLQQDVTDGVLLADIIAAVTGSSVQGVVVLQSSAAKHCAADKKVAEANIRCCLKHLSHLGVPVNHNSVKDIVDGKLRPILELFFNLSRCKACENTVAAAVAVAGSSASSSGGSVRSGIPLAKRPPPAAATSTTTPSSSSCSSSSGWSTPTMSGVQSRLPRSSQVGEKNCPMLLITPTTPPSSDSMLKTPQRPQRLVTSSSASSSASLPVGGGGRLTQPPRRSIVNAPKPTTSKLMQGMLSFGYAPTPSQQPPPPPPSVVDSLIEHPFMEVGRSSNRVVEEVSLSPHSGVGADSQVKSRRSLQFVQEKDRRHRSVSASPAHSLALSSGGGKIFSRVLYMDDNDDVRSSAGEHELGSSQYSILPSESLTSLEKGHDKTKGNWLRISLSKAFRRKRGGKSGANSDSEMDSPICPVKTSPSANSIAFDEVTQLRNQLQEADMKLTDIRLEALSSAHRLQQLKEIVCKMRHEMSTLRADNDRLRQLLHTSTSSTSSPSSSNNPLKKFLLLNDSNVMMMTNADPGSIIRLESPHHLREVGRPNFNQLLSNHEDPLCGRKGISLNVSILLKSFPLDGEKDQEEWCIGTVTIQPGTSWSTLEDDTFQLLQTFCKLVDPVLGLGLDDNSLLSWRLLDVTRHRRGDVSAVSPDEGVGQEEDDCAADRSPWMVVHTLHWTPSTASRPRSPGLSMSPRSSDRLKQTSSQAQPAAAATIYLHLRGGTGGVSGSGQKQAVSLKDNHHNSELDFWVLSSLIRKPFLQQCLSILLNQRQVILHGPEGSGKTHLSHTLANQIISNCGTNTANPDYLLIVDAEHKSKREIRSIWSRALDQKPSPSCTNQLQVLIVDNVSQFDYIQDLLQETSHHASIHGFPYVIVTIHKCHIETSDLLFKSAWIKCTEGRDAGDSFLGRYLRRKLAHYQVNSLQSRAPILTEIIAWMPCVWKHLQGIVSTHGAGGSISDRLFLSCPMSTHDSQMWFVDLWNYSLLPFIINVMRSNAKLSAASITTVSSIHGKAAGASTELMSSTETTTWCDPLLWIKESWPWSAVAAAAAPRSELPLNASINRSKLNELTLLDERDQLLPLRPEDIGHCSYGNYDNLHVV